MEFLLVVEQVLQGVLSRWCEYQIFAMTAYCLDIDCSVDVDTGRKTVLSPLQRISRSAVEARCCRK